MISVLLRGPRPDLSYLCRGTGGPAISAVLTRYRDLAGHSSKHCVAPSTFSPLSSPFHHASKLQVLHCSVGDRLLSTSSSDSDSSSSPIVVQDYGHSRKKSYFYSEKMGSKNLIKVKQQLSKQSLSDAQREQTLAAVVKTPPLRRFVAPALPLLLYFLPKDYPLSVTENYTSFTKWSALQSIFSSISGVLSTQALLFAVGVGAPVAIPASAALNWVLKDGLGQIGGVLYAGMISTHFDSEPKRYRMLSAVALDAAILLEIMTPFFPFLFVPLAALANVGKNISWLAASATKAAIHKSLCRGENLADLTAKSGSQTIFCSLLGTTAGVALASAIGNNLSSVLIAYCVLTFFHLLCNYKSLSSIIINTINRSRAHLLFQHFVAHMSGPDGQDGTVPQAKNWLRTPAQISQEETVFSSWPLGSNRATTTAAAQPTISLSSPLTQLAETEENLYQLRKNSGVFPFIINVTIDGRPLDWTSSSSQQDPMQAVARLALSDLKIHVLFEERANNKDILLGLFCAHHLQSIIRQAWQGEWSHRLANSQRQMGVDVLKNEMRNLIQQSQQAISRYGEKVARDLKESGWQLDNLFIMEDQVRIKFTSL